MKTLIIYDSKYGCTEKCANLLKGKLKDAEIYNVNKFDKNLNEYEKIIIGSSVYIGKIKDTIKDFCERNLLVLKQKQIALFTCGVRPGEDGKVQLANAYPNELSDIAIAKENFGGEIYYEKLDNYDRSLTDMVINAEGSNFPKFDENKTILLVDEEKINGFANMLE